MKKSVLFIHIFLLSVVALSSKSISADFNPCDYGAKGDGETVRTESIQKAIDACAQAGGGTIVFSPGTYMTHMLKIDTSNDRLTRVFNIQFEILPPSI